MGGPLQPRGTGRWRVSVMGVALCAVLASAWPATALAQVDAAGVDGPGPRDEQPRDVRWLLTRDLALREVDIAAITARGVVVREGTRRKTRVIPLGEVLAVLPGTGVRGLSGDGFGDGMGADGGAGVGGAVGGVAGGVVGGARWNDLGVDREHGLLQLADGQRWPGDLLNEQAEHEDAVRWNSTALGAVEVPLERVARMVLAPAQGDGEARTVSDAPRGELAVTTSDRVRLLNGDVLEGFVASVGEKIEIEIAGKVRAIDASSVDQIVFAATRTRSPEILAWLVDGSVVGAVFSQVARDQSVSAVESMSVERPQRSGGSGEEERGSSLRLIAPDGTPGRTIEMDELTGVALRNDALMPLSSLRIASQKPMGERRWSPPVRAVAGAGGVGSDVLFAGDLELPGPLEVSWVLPAGAARMACRVVLPASGRAWADVEVRVLVREDGQEGGQPREVASAVLSRENPAAVLNVDLIGGVLAGARAAGGAERTLIVRVEAGKMGPIQDTVRLERGVILLDGERAGPAR